MDAAPTKNAPRLTPSERFANALVAMTGATFFGHCVSATCEQSAYPLLASSFLVAFLLVTTVMFGSDWRHRYRRALAGLAIVLINLVFVH